MSGAAARKVGSEIDIAWFMPRLSFSVLSLYPIPSNRPPLPPPNPRRNVCSISLYLPPPSSLHRAISIPLGLTPLALGPSLLFVNTGDVSQVRQNLISTRIARQNRLPRLARRLFLYARHSSSRSDRISAWKSSRALKKGNRALERVPSPFLSAFLFSRSCSSSLLVRSNSNENELRKSWTN